MAPALGALLGLLFVAACAGWGWALLSACGRRPSADPERALAYPLAGLFAAAALASVLWIAGGFRAEFAWAIVAAGLCLAARGWMRDGRSAWRDFRAAGGTKRSIWLPALPALLIAIPALLSPDTSWDSDTFHLIVPRDAAEHGSLPLLVDDLNLLNLVTSYTWIGWGYLLAGLRCDAAGRVIFAATALLALLLATRRVARNFHPRLGLIVWLLALYTPAWIVQWGSAMVDHMVFALSACGLALLAPRIGERRMLALGFCALGLAAASKHWGVFSALALAAVWCGEALLARSARPLHLALLLGACCVAGALPWFVKNEWTLGNPLAVAPGDEDPVAMARHRLFAHDVLPVVTMHPESRVLDGWYPLSVLRRIASGFPWTSALSPLLFLWIPFAWRLRGQLAPWRRALWGGLVALFALFVRALPGVNQDSPPRYFLNLAAWAYFAAALGWHEWAGASPRRARAAWLLFIAVSLPTVGLAGARALRRMPLVAGTESLAEFWEKRDAAAPLFATVNRTFGPADKLFVIGERVILLEIPRRQFVRAYQAHWAAVTTAEELRAAWDQWGITHVLVNDCPGELWQRGVLREWFTEAGGALRGWELLEENRRSCLYRRAGTRAAGQAALPAAQAAESPVLIAEPSFVIRALIGEQEH